MENNTSEKFPNERDKRNEREREREREIKPKQHPTHIVPYVNKQ